jgi:hypothetical protein
METMFGKRGEAPSSLESSTGEVLATAGAAAAAAAEQCGRVHLAAGAMDFPLDPIERSIDLFARHVCAN